MNAVKRSVVLLTRSPGCKRPFFVWLLSFISYVSHTTTVDNEQCARLELPAPVIKVSESDRVHRHTYADAVEEHDSCGDIESVTRVSVG